MECSAVSFALLHSDVDSNTYATYIIATSNTRQESNAPQGRSEVDSHANMVLLGKDSYIFDGVQNRTCNVQPFDPSLGISRKIPIIDGAIAYDCPFSMKTYIFIFKNALLIPTLNHNLIPPFILREAGIKVKDVPKIQVDNPRVEDHSLYIDELDLRVPLKLNGIFSFFHTRKPTHKDLISCENMFLTPELNSWNPYSDHFADNEEAMLDWEGNMMESQFRKRLKQDDNLYINSSMITVDEYNKAIDAVVADETAIQPLNQSIYSSTQTDVEDLAVLLEQQANISKVQIATGSTAVSHEADDLFDFDLNSAIDSVISSLDIDALDKEVVGSALASLPDKVNADFLSKIWNINHEEVEGFCSS